ncbi:MAG: hypothetical protein P8J36_03235 [Flavobacteriales bacterium]|nr:hypothetical protein [Flavobacteriales bacterium]
MANLKANRKEMIKRLLIFTIIISSINPVFANVIDTSFIEGLTAFKWVPISDADKIMQYENQKTLTRRTIEQAKTANNHYTTAVDFMKKKEYSGAISEFELAMKRYKRAKLSPDGMNYVHANMALTYASTGNSSDLLQAERLLNLITNKAYVDNNWAYNIAMGHYLVGNQDEAASLLSSIIRKDEFYFQAYVTLEAIYRNSGNDEDADIVNERAYTAENKKIRKLQKKTEARSEARSDRKKKNTATVLKGKKPDVKNLKIVVGDDNLQFNKIDKINDRSMVQIQEGIVDYKNGIIALGNREFKAAQKPLKNAEKKLKRGKITDDGLNFSRGNLAIAFLASGEKSGVGQAKRYIKNLTPKLFTTREWSYNIAVAYYELAFISARLNKKDGTRNWGNTTATAHIKNSIKLFQKAIKQDKLYLPSYENLIYIYRQQGEPKKAEKMSTALMQARSKLMKSFSKNDQLDMGGAAYVFRVNLGSFGKHDTPANLYDEPNLITVPRTENNTIYLAGLFYSLDEATKYQEEMTRKGYSRSFIVAYKDGEEITEF